MITFIRDSKKTNLIYDAQQTTGFMGQERVIGWEG